MFGKKNKDAVYLTYDEKSILLRALVELKNSLIREGKYTDAVDELILKLAKQLNMNKVLELKKVPLHSIFNF